LLIAVIAPAVANAAIAFSASAVAVVAPVIADAVITAAVVDCYVFVTPSLDFDGAGRRQRHP